MTNNHDETTREKILEATRKLINGTPLEEITTRKIAAEAGVNVAAINYHFRTKEKLIGEAVASFTVTALEYGAALLADPTKPASERLTIFLQGYAKGLTSAPALTRTAFRTFLFDEAADGHYHTLMRRMLTLLSETLAEASGSSDEARTVRNSLALYAAVAFPILARQTLPEPGIADFSEGEARDKYIADMVRTFIHANSESE